MKESLKWLSIIWKGKLVEINAKGRIRKPRLGRKGFCPVGWEVALFEVLKENFINWLKEKLHVGRNKN